MAFSIGSCLYAILQSMLIVYNPYASILYLSVRVNTGATIHFRMIIENNVPQIIIVNLPPNVYR